LFDVYFTNINSVDEDVAGHLLNNSGQSKTQSTLACTCSTKDASWPQKGEIQFKDVELKYRPDTELVLKKCSVKMNGGHKIGIVGRTGAGKSTLSLALTRIVEKMAGNIFIDGVDISEINIKQVREKITIIP
jgi:ABC-type multidrug transport system fused ATPase/permease subunit